MMTLFTDIDHDFDHDCVFNLSKARYYTIAVHYSWNLFRLSF